MAIFMIGLLLTLLLPVLEKGRQRGVMARCWGTLRQVGVGYNLFAQDHNDHFPMEISVGAGGTKEFNRPPAVADAEFGDAFRHFQVLSNELATPRILVCRADKREPAVTFAALQNSNVSYFVATEAAFARPLSLLAGDRNLMVSGTMSDQVGLIQAGNEVFWTSELHGYRGNLLYADASVRGVNNPGLREALHQSLTNTIIILPPAKLAMTVEGVEEAPAPVAGQTSFKEASSHPSTNTAPLARLTDPAVRTAERGGSIRQPSSAPVSPAGEPTALAQEAKPASSKTTPSVSRVPTNHVASGPDLFSAASPNRLREIFHRCGNYAALLLLLLLLAVMMALEVQRHRHRKRRAMRAEAPQG